MRNFFIKFTVFGMTFLFTGFTFANTYEVVFNRDIPLAGSVERSSNQTAINSAVQDFETRLTSNNTDSVAALDRIERLEIPALKAQITTEESRLINNEWYARPSTAHYIGLNKNKYGVTVDYLVYAIKSWRTLPAPERIEQGMEVVVHYGNGAGSVLQVTEKKVLPFDRSLLVSKSEYRQVLLVLEDPDAGVYYGFSLEAKV